MGSRDAGQFLVEHASEGEQVVTLVPQRDAHRANAPQVLRLGRSSSSMMKSNNFRRVARSGQPAPERHGSAIE